MRHILVCLSIVVIGGWLAGCSSEPYMGARDPDATSGDPPGDAYAGDIFYGKPMPDHRTDKKWEFYYKHCTMDDDFFVSKRSYACSDAF